MSLAAAIQQMDVEWRNGTGSTAHAFRVYPDGFVALRALCHARRPEADEAVSPSAITLTCSKCEHAARRLNARRNNR